MRATLMLLFIVTLAACSASSVEPEGPVTAGGKPPIEVTTPSSGGEASTATPLSLDLHVGDAVVPLGQAPAIRVEITNRGDREVYLVGSLDGSDCQMRYPHCYFEVIGPDGKSAVGPIGRCGNTNAIRAQDFAAVAPNEGFDPYRTVDGAGFFSAHQLSPENFGRAGQYRIRFTYSTDQDDFGLWNGFSGVPVSSDDRARQLHELWEKVPRTSVTSDWVTVTVHD